MKAKTMIVLPLIILAVLLVIGWLILSIGPTEPQPSTTPHDLLQPQWFATQDDPEYLFTYGEAARDSEIESVNAAEEEALSKAPMSVELYLFEIIATITEESVELPPYQLERIHNLVNTVAQKAIPGSSITERESYLSEQGNHVTFVRHQMPLEEINRAFVEMVQQEDELYSLLQGSESFRDLVADF